MGRDREDVIFLEQVGESLRLQQELDLPEETSLWVRESRALLESALHAFGELVEREDAEEDEAREALEGLRAARFELDASFSSLLVAMDIRLGELKLEGERASEALLPLAQFLNRYHAGEFETLRLQGALGQCDQALGMAREWGIDRQWVEPLERAIAQVSAAREAAASEGAEAVGAYGALVEGRSVARICYLAARDLLSAALRFEGSHDRLDEIMPPLSSLLAPPHH